VLTLKSIIPLLLVFTLAFNIGTNFINILSKSLNCELVETDFPKEIDADDDEVIGYLDAHITSLNPLNYKKRQMLNSIFYALNPLNKLTTPPPEWV
jgi:hypothetical protein